MEGEREEAHEKEIKNEIKKSFCGCYSTNRKDRVKTRSVVYWGKYRIDFKGTFCSV